jgi:hypothetical protein
MSIAEVDDEAFIAAIESASLPNVAFRHGDHLRAGYLYLRRYGYPGGIDATASAIRAFAKANGMPEAFHFTLTVAWVRCIAAHSHDACAVPFSDFLSHNAELTDSTLLLRFYSRERLFTTAARTNWRDPDLRPLPSVTPWKPGPRTAP